jgi:hypothetical protein
MRPTGFAEGNSRRGSGVMVLIVVADVTMFQNSGKHEKIGSRCAP